MPIYPLQLLRRGGAMWASPPTHNMKLQQDGASRTPPPTRIMKLQQDGASSTPRFAVLLVPP